MGEQTAVVEAARSRALALHGEAIAIWARLFGDGTKDSAIGGSVSATLDRLAIAVSNAGEPESDVAELHMLAVALGLAPVAHMRARVGNEVDLLTAVADIIRYRSAADLRVSSTDGDCWLVDEGLLRASGVGWFGNPDMPLLPVARDGLLRQNLRPPVPELWAELLAIIETGQMPVRGRIGPQPVFVLSTAGNLSSMRAGLRRYMENFVTSGHSNIRLLVVDDAPSCDSEAVAELIAQLRTEFGADIQRFGEWDGNGLPGAKARWRNAIASRLPDMRDTVERTFSPGAPGSANAAFALLAGLPIVWLEQDSYPVVLTAGRDTDIGATRQYPASTVQREHTADLPGRFDQLEVAQSLGLRVLPVDVVHIVDRILYGALDAPIFERDEYTWEDAGFELVARVDDGLMPDQTTQVMSCHFHLSGHGDYRARFSHLLLLANPAGRDNDDPQYNDDPECDASAADLWRTTILESGGLDRVQFAVTPPESATVRAAKCGFGTVVGLRHDLPLVPIMMPTTSIRCFDFALGLLLRAAGSAPAGWAATALTHIRESTTTSGRGELDAYQASEILLWPFLHTVQSILEANSRHDGEPQAHWLARTGAALCAAANQLRLAETVSRRLWALAAADATVAQALARAAVAAGRSAAPYQERVGDAPHRPWLTVHRELEEMLAAEVARYGNQLLLWSRLDLDLLAAAKSVVSGVSGWQI